MTRVLAAYCRTSGTHFFQDVPVPYVGHYGINAHLFEGNTQADVAHYGAHDQIIGKCPFFFHHPSTDGKDLIPC